jgi:transcriptional regulator with XRE-family HTH domain/predicted GIY-YIG superfamily endonuclease
MKNFGETIRELRIAQDLGLRETATKVGISPAYLSRIERSKERPPRPEVIKDLARVLAADPDVLFRLSSSADPEIVDYLHDQVEVMNLLRYIKESGFTEVEIKSLIQTAKSIKANSHIQYKEIIMSDISVGEFMLHEYNRYKIEQNAKKLPGLYYITKMQGITPKLIYVGESENVRKRLLRHFEGKTKKSDCIKSHQPGRFGYSFHPDFSSKEKRLEVEKFIIDKYKPLCND